MLDAELKKVIDDLGAAVTQMRADVEAEAKKADGVLTGRIQKLNDTIDSLSAKKDELEKKMTQRVDELEVKLNRQSLTSGTSEKQVKELELFNLERKSQAAQKQKPIPSDIDQEEYDLYKKNFRAFLRKGDKTWSSEEHKAMSVGSDPDGGYLVPADTSGRIMTRLFDFSPIRQIANVQSISTDALEGLKDTDEASVGYAGEQASRPATTTPQLGKWRIPVWEIYAKPEATQQLLDDARVSVENWLSMKVSDKLARFEGKEFVTGTGSNAVRGFASYNTAATGDATRAWGVLEHVATGVAGDFAASNPADIFFDLEAAFKPGYLAGAQWVTRRSVIQKIRKFRDSTGQYLWQPGLQVGKAATLIGYPITMAEDMPALASGSLSLALGNFQEGYQIVDRAGISVLRDPYSNKPFVQFYTTYRVGGDVVQFETIKFIKFS